jgi:hypothetical protein
VQKCSNLVECPAEHAARINCVCSINVVWGSPSVQSSGVILAGNATLVVATVPTCNYTPMWGCFSGAATVLECGVHALREGCEFYRVCHHCDMSSNFTGPS